MDELWTLDELSERVAAALARDYPGQPSGRVREVPDRRTIRWYTSIGLVDRPATMRGRTALYGRRHLAQLVAIKRLQAEGRPLASIQRQLAGATDATLARVARLPDGIDTFGRNPPGAAQPAAATSATPATRPPGGRFWSAARVTERSAEHQPGPTRPVPLAFGSRAAAQPHQRPAEDKAARPDQDTTLAYGVPLGESVTLLLAAAGHAPDRDDIDAVQRAAAPLIDLLERRGLIRPDNGRTPP